ncbi:hypothetical protein [Neoroseomonas rubea]|uniref:hypothetical protein n=1 Tax=Neoroseomonas rubea TaxID=2748666 RepID=UPI0018DF21AE|nr:hypothetical protein [Roseomonas rubea]
MSGFVTRARAQIRAGFTIGDAVAEEIAAHPPIPVDAPLGALIQAAAAAPALLGRVEDARRSVATRIARASDIADAFEREIEGLEAVCRYLEDGAALPVDLPPDLALAARALGGTDDAKATARQMRDDIEHHRRTLTALRDELPRARSALRVAASGWKANAAIKTASPDQAELSRVHKAELERHKSEFLRRKRIAA